MERLTRQKDEYPCRVIDCFAEEWMLRHTGKGPDYDVCEDCPFEQYINALAAYEDKEEVAESNNNSIDYGCINAKIFKGYGKL